MELSELIDNTNYEHSRVVSKISLLMAKKAGFPERECQIIAQAALCHDVGKAVIPPSILNKPSSLTPDEYEIIKTHTAAGYDQITETIQTLTIAAQIARQHHEQENGLGYYHMSGGEIHPYAKLVAVADVFDALYSRRPYKEPWSIGKIKDYFTKQAGNQFNKEAVMLLFSALSDVLPLYKRP